MLRFATFAFPLLLIFSLMQAGARADTFTGTWTITASSTPGQVHLDMRYRHTTLTGSDEWEESHDVPAPRVTNGGFTIAGDAGEFRAQGTFTTPTQGGGMWTFVPSQTFVSELQRRGVNRPTDKEQFELAIGNFKLSTLDALIAAGFARPSVADLVRMTEHGVTDRYVSQLKGLQYSSKNVDSLVRLHDHGVTAQYVQEMLSYGYRPSADELVRLVDHGVTAQYVQSLQSMGYHPSPDDLVRLADHGVTAAFVQRMRSHGYTHLSADDLIRLRDNGF